MASIYGSKSSPASSSSPSATKSIYSSTSSPKKESSGRGGVLGVGQRFVTDLKDAAVNLPAGVYMLGDAVVQDVKEPDKAHLAPILKEMGKATVQDFKHPLRHPGNTALDVLALASLGAGTVARASAVTKAVQAGGDAGRVLKAATSSPREARVIRYTNPQGDTHTAVAGNYSRSALSRSVQKGLDKAREAQPQRKIVSTKTQAQRFGKAFEANQAILYKLEKADALEVSRMTRGLSKPQLEAIRNHLEGTTPTERLAFFRKNLAEGVDVLGNGERVPLSRRATARLQKAIAWNAIAERDGLVSAEGMLTDPKLQQVADRIRALSEKRTSRLVEEGAVTPESAAYRETGPQKLIRGGGYYVSRGAALAAAQAVLRDAERASRAVERDARREARRLGRQYATLRGEAAKAEREYFRLKTTRGADERGVLALEGEDAQGALAAAENMREQAAAAALAKTQRLRAEADAVRAQAERAIPDARRQAQDVLAAAASKAQDVASRGHSIPYYGPPLRPAVRVPYARSYPPRFLGKMKGTGAGGVVGINQKPGSFTHGFMGVILKHGGGHKNLGRVVAADYLEASRWWNSEETRQAFRKIGQVSPAGLKDPIAVKLRPVVLSQDIKDLVTKVEDGSESLTRAEEAMLRRELEDQFGQIIPKDQGVQRSLREAAQVRPQDGVVFIERALLGGLDKPTPLVGATAYGAFNAFMKTADTVNNAQRAAILYLKPAYAVPNALGNLALTLVQQGFAAPRNLAEACRLYTRVGKAKWGPDVVAKIDTLMEEGMSSVLASEQGALSGATQWMASKWSLAVDLPFRRASFFHEARAAGYKSPAQLRALVSDPALRDDLFRVAKEANRDLIDYGNLNSWERGVVRRVIFFYPWVKGSTVYAGRFLRDHPVLAGTSAAIGREGAVGNERTFGPLPSWAEGLIRTGGSDAFPRVVNPASVAILQTPAQVLEAASTPIFGGQGGAYEPLSQLSPAAAALYEAVTGVTPLGYTLPPNKSRLGDAASNMYRSQPYYLLAKRLMGESPGKTYSYSPRDALMQMLVGASFAPRTANRAQLNKQAKREQAGR